MGRERCRVVVKCRPTFPHEEEGLGDGIQLPAPGRVLLGKEFEADHVYLPSDGDLVYEDEVKSLVSSLYEGINSTVFAYGASGSGKTHTMLGCQDSPGLVDRISDEVFERYDQRSCTVSVSVEELYCERFTDLLAASGHPQASSSNLSNSSSISNLSNSHLGSRGSHLRPPAYHRQASHSRYSWQSVTLPSSNELKARVQHVLRKRHTASTCLNDKSSRSHVIVTITLEQRRALNEHKFTEDEDLPQSSASSTTSAGATNSSVIVAGRCGSMPDLSSLRQQDSVETRSVQEDASSEAGGTAGLDTYLIGKLYLVDLAGSENIKRSGAEGARQKEAGEINKSLCHLKTVIEEVFKGRKAITYRNSKLTMRLQDALGGGNSKLLVVACISTAKSDLLETKETLRFAEMARAITNTPVVNREPKDEIIHRLEQKLEDLQDQLRLARQEGGKAATEEVLQQLNVVEAAYADLQADMENKAAKWKQDEAAWTQAAINVREQVCSLHSLLSESQAQEASLKEQLAQEQAAMQQVVQQLTAEQGARLGSQQAGAAAAALLLSMRQDIAALLQLCTALQQQVAEQRSATAAALDVCGEQQEHASKLQQQLATTTAELQVKTQQLRQECAARSAADVQVAELQQQCSALQQQVLTEQVATAAATAQCTQQEQRSQQLQQQLDGQAHELKLLQQQLQEERNARAAADAQIASLQQRQQVLHRSAQQAADEAGQGMQALVSLCTVLQGQTAAAAVQQAQAKQQHQAVLASLQASEASQMAVLEQLAAAKRANSQQSRDIAALQVQLKEQQQEHAAVLSATSAATAQAAAAAAKEHLKQRQALEQKLQAAQDSTSKLQAQLEDERSEHEAILAAERLRHSQQLAENMQSSVKKLTADKLRCREHISLQVTSLKAEAQSLYQALASPSPMFAGLPDSTPVSPAAADCLGSSTPAGELQAQQQLSPAALQAARQGVVVPPLQLEPSDAMLSDTTAAPMQDASERHLGLLSGEETCSECTSGGSSSAVTPGAGAVESAAATAALVAVAAAAAAATATRAAALRKSLLAEQTNVVSVHVEAGSQGGWAGSQNLSNAGGSSCASEGRCSPAADALLPICRTASASPSISSFDGSVHSGMHPAAAAAATAAAAAVAARVRSSHEQQSRQRRRRRDFGRALSAGSWPMSYLPKEEVDMTGAAAAFHQLRGGALNVDSLQHFLEHRMLGGKLHAKTLPGGGRKRKHHLVQDMLAYHRWHLANCGAASSDRSSSAGGTAAGASSSAATPTPRSLCSSPDSAIWHPLGTTRPASAVPSSSISSPAKADIMRYSHDSPAAVRSSGGGCYLTEPMPSRAVFATEAADAGNSRQQPDVGLSEQQPQQSTGRWSWLTPRRRKQQSILAQLQASEKAAVKKQLSLNTWPAEPTTDLSSVADLRSTEQPYLSVQLPERESEGGCDAVSPRDKKHAAAAGRSGSQRSSPKGVSLAGKAISACTGSAVNEFYVDSPAVKLTRGRAGHGRQPGSSTDTGRLSLEVGSAHRSSWRQVQLTRHK